MPTVRFLVLQPTPFCNIACKYCYLPDRSSTATMTLDTLERIVSDLCSCGWVGEELDIIWHAGEPLVLPVDYYAKAFELIRRLLPDRTKLHHAFQTNGMLIDDTWCEFFKTTGATVGVSVDGPATIHDAHRVTRSGKPTFSRVVEGIRSLRRHGVDFAVITVLTSASLSRAKELHDFYQQEGIENVCFNVEEIEGVNTKSSMLGADRTSEFEQFIRAFWNLNVRSQSLYYVREFKNMLEKIVRPADHLEIDNTLTQPFDHVSVDWQGNYSTFSPEFLGNRNALYDNFTIGNVWTNRFIDSLESDTFKRLSRDVSAGVDLCRRTCEYFPVCGGGSPVNKLYENGTLISTETLYCRLNVKVLAKVALEIIENSARGDLDDKAAAHDHPAPAPSGRPLARSAPPLESLCDDPLVRRHRIVVSFGEGTGTVEDIEVSAGTGGPPAILHTVYDEGARVPLGGWRRLTSEEASAVLAKPGPPRRGNTVSVVRMPADLLEPFEVLRAAARRRSQKEELLALLHAKDVRDGTVAVGAYVRRRFGRPDGECRDEAYRRIAVNEPGLTTITQASGAGTLVGLHVDDWYAHPISRRHLAPNRICINLGCEDRFLLFVDVPVASMARILQRAGRKTLGHDCTSVARTFMASYPAYPVLRLRVRPGEAYLAPTENIAHDASSCDMSTFDISLHLRGEFDPASGARPTPARLSARRAHAAP